MSVSVSDLNQGELLKYHKRLEMQLQHLEFVDLHALYKGKKHLTVEDFEIVVSRVNLIVNCCQALIYHQEAKGLDCDIRYVAYIRSSIRSHNNLKDWAMSRIKVAKEIENMRKTYNQGKLDPLSLIGGSDV